MSTWVEHTYTCPVCGPRRQLVKDKVDNVTTEGCTGTHDAPHGRKVLQITTRPLFYGHTPEELAELYPRLQRTAEAHLNACMEAMDEWDANTDTETEVESPACGPFCGCETCVVREILHACLEDLIVVARQEAVGG